MSRDTSFYYSFLVLPPRKRRAIIAVWDFCRAVDDAVDEVVPSAVDGLAATRGPPASRLRCGARSWTPAISGREPATRAGKALQPYIREFNLPRQPFEELIDGVEMDLAQSRYPTFRRAGRILPPRRLDGRPDLHRDLRLPRSRDARVCREPRDGAAAHEHHSRRRGRPARRDACTCPPRTWCGSASPRRPAGGSGDGRRCASCCGSSASGRAYYYRCAAAELPAADARSLVAAEIMGGIYFEILRRIERAGYDVFSRRIRVPRPYRALDRAAHLGAGPVLAAVDSPTSSSSAPASPA